MRSIIFFLVALTFTTLQAQEPKRVILTGGPGAGKTTILLGMEQRGYDIVNEAASDIIKMDLAKKVNQPWDQEDFQKKVLELQTIRQERALKSDKDFIFFDRAPFDTMTYQRIKWPQQDRKFLENAVKKLKEEGFYHPTVFIIENFGQCLNNEVRHETKDEALLLQRQIEEEYRNHGFRVVKIPPEEPEKRIERILTELCADDLPSLARIQSSSASASTP